ncbi:MAG: hypothetical protein ACLFMX_01145 [Halobacteriales archaeon]
MARAPHRSHLQLLAGALVMVVALLHLLHERAGFPRLVVLVSVGQPLLDPRPLAFTLLGTALIVGVLATWNGYLDRRGAYLAGIVAMGVLLIGYVLWHLTGHGAFWPYHPGEAELHPGNPVVVILDHLRINPWELASKVSELTALALLGYLHATDDRRGRG